MDGQHKSIFSYNVTRPYPYWWFTPVTTIGAAILTALFSWLNYASNGFEMTVITSSDPNATMASPGALYGLPSLLTDKYKPTCQPANIPVNSRFFTNNTGLQYELLEISQRKPNDEDDTVLPVLAYSNNVLSGCAITSIQLELSQLDRTAIQIPLSAFGTVVRTYANCNISTSDGPVGLSLVNGYELVPPTLNVASLLSTINRTSTNVVSNFVSRNSTSRASLWWGESILSANWVWFANAMTGQHITKNGYRTSKGWLAFRQSPNNSAVDILDPFFLEVDWRLVDLNAKGNMSIGWAGSENTWYASRLNESGKYPSTWWPPAEKLAKSAWSTVLVDLGQKNQSNILLDGRTLALFTADFANQRSHKGQVHFGPETAPYNPTKPHTGPLGTTPAVIATEYICNVPRRKATSSIIWSILVADLVFLQWIWTVFKLLVDAFLLGKNKRQKPMSTAGSKSARSSREDA